MALFSSLLDSLAQQSLWSTALAVFFGTLLLLVLKSWWDSRRLNSLLEDHLKVGEVTLQELGKYDGSSPFLPILFSVKSTVYDVSNGKDFYGPGGGYAVFAGKEVARALGLMSLKAEDCTANLSGLTEKQLETLKDWETKFKEKYPIVGQVVEPRELTLEQLRGHDGNDPSKPIYLAIKGTIFDVSTGRQFYGPDGIYPFAGRECARAFALLSTDTKDCTDNLDDLHRMELDQLRDWQDKFYSKYKIVGTVVQH